MNFNWKAFWDERAKQDAVGAGGRGEQVTTIELIRSIVEAARKLELSSGDRVLDVGCAIGAFCLVISPFVKEVVGLDFSSEMVKEALKNFAASRCSNCHAIVGDVRKLPYQKDEFDKVNCWSIIQCVDNPNEGLGAISELYRVLKPGGLLLLGGTPNARTKKDYINSIWQLNKPMDEKKKIAERNEKAIWYDPDELLSFVNDQLGGNGGICETEAGEWYKGLHFDLVVRKCR